MEATAVKVRTPDKRLVASMRRWKTGWRFAGPRCGSGSGRWHWVGRQEGMARLRCSAAAVVLLAAGRDGVGPAARADKTSLARGGGRRARRARTDGCRACRSCERLRCRALPGDAGCSLQAFEPLAGRLHLIAGFEQYRRGLRQFGCSDGEEKSGENFSWTLLSFSI